MTGAGIGEYLEEYAGYYNLPVQYGTVVTDASMLENGGYAVRTGKELFHTKNAVIATGPLQKPKIPVFSVNIPAGIHQIHSGQYRNPGTLPPGAVFVAGSAQSGTQIAEELYRSGRPVYLSVGSAPRIPRRYRGLYFIGMSWLYKRKSPLLLGVGEDAAYIVEQLLRSDGGGN